ncbi:DNA polymerase [Mycena indigotica]|uniref:DNA polymerase n=1 Tax=Mycena indigotica TaxID=2126181 RepID=A0A8H6W9S8_9AGAR|nr:DNA polymerase [Mycena indigotica]KAF7306933.1 DNA polymerase [Mycena indigotica]
MTCVMQVQINNIDHYLAPPSALDDADNFSAVPVIRIFGPSSLGQKCCVHIHQVYPYFYVEYIDSLKSPRKVNRYITKLTKSLNLAIALSFKKDLNVAQKQAYIRAIILVKGVPFYGFHSSYKPFLKIYLLNPGLLNRAVTILRSGLVLSTRFRIFESHINFPLQFMVDFGLEGCGWLELGEVLKRGEDDGRQTSPIGISSLYRATNMPLEFDATAFQILNRQRIVSRNLHHKLQIPAPPLPPEPLVLGVRELWEDERKRRRARGLDPTPDIPVDPSDSARTPRGEWVSELRWWEEIRHRIERERMLEPLTVLQHAWEDWALTVFSSVEALWRQTHRNSQLAGFESNAEYDEVETEMSMTAEQITRLVADEAALEKDLERGDSPEPDLEEGEEAEFDEEEVADAEEASSPASSTDPFNEDEDELNQNRSGAFSEGGLVLSSPPNLDEYIDFDEPTTPTRSRAPDRQIIGTSPASAASDYNSEYSPLHPPSKRRRLDVDLIGGSVAYLVSHNAMTIKTKPKPIGKNCFEYSPAPPTTQRLLTTLDTYQVASKVYQRPHYSNDNDVQRPRIYGGLTYHKIHYCILQICLSQAVGSTLEALRVLVKPKNGSYKKALRCELLEAWDSASLRGVLVISPLKFFFTDEQQIEGPSLKNIYGLKSMPLDGATSVRGTPSMSVLSLEIFVSCENIPVPARDPIVAASIAFRDGDASDTFSKVIFTRGTHQAPSLGRREVQGVSTELELINAIIDTILDRDPDILVGWEVQDSSWGYLDERSRVLELSLVSLISRTLNQTERSGNNDQWSSRQNSSFKVSGRHVLNLWRVMRSEITLNAYTFENVAFHCLGRRIPHFNQLTMKRWLGDPSPERRTRVYSQLAQRCEINLDILEKTEVVTKTAEFARVFGVEWFSVLSRGSQFKVESFMFRIAKPENFMLLSPSKDDVGRQNAAEAMPLILEPQSTFYTNPVLVLDFQSLYPSIMIAENYCYSTFVGRIKEFQGRQKFGVDPDLKLSPGLVESLYDHITVSPTGMMFVKPEVRKGLLGRMLTELLDTRVMVKHAMKGAGSDKALKKVLDARQLGLKYIANVTYGYTSATFSGRMPAVEIADSIVQSGRETLEKAISVINSEQRWGAEVVYGDTDSVFVHLPGKTKDQAFRIGYEMSERITSMWVRQLYAFVSEYPIGIRLLSNSSSKRHVAITRSSPHLLFPKVYLPSVLLAKKRYVGYRYDQPDDVQPIFDAKGIETVRRDGVPAQKKMTEAVLHMLFRTQDLSKIKDYCVRSWQRILEGKVTIEDFIFAKEVRLGGYSDKAPPPPGAVVAAREALTGRGETQYKERVRYVICHGPGRLVDRAYTPQEVINNRQAQNLNLRLDGEYYISRVLIPPLDRILSLAGADVRKWYEDMPKAYVYTEAAMSPTKAKPRPDYTNQLIDENFYRTQCLACEAPSDDDICDECWQNPEVAMPQVLTKIRRGEARLLDIARICASCSRTPLGEPIECDSLDCSWFYARKKAEARLDFLEAIQNVTFE